MKTIPIILLLLTSLSVLAKPEFVALPGTPEYLAAQTGTNALPATPAPAAKPAPVTSANTTAIVKPVQTAKPVTNSFAALPAAKPVVSPAPAQPAAPAVLPVVTQSVAKAASPQSPPPQMPASMRPGTPGGFGMIKQGNTSAAPATPAPKADSTSTVSHVPRRTAPTATPASNTEKPIEMTPSASATAPVAAPAATQNAVPAPVAIPVAPVAVLENTPAPAVKPAAPVAAPVATPVATPVAAPVAAAIPRVAPPPSAPVNLPSTHVQAAQAQAQAIAANAPPANPLVNEPPAAAAVNATAPAPSAASPAPPRDSGPPVVLKFQNMPLEQVLEQYSDMVKRTLLRPASLPTANITITTKNDLTKEEAIQALDAVLSLNGIVMIPVGEKFMKVVPTAQANQEAAPLNTRAAAELPEFGQYVTHVVQLKYSKPSELATVLQQFAKMPGSVFPVDSNQILILRDNTENVKRMLEMIERIDVAVPSEFVSEVIPIKYALADDIQSALSSISGAGGGGGTAAGGRTATPARGLAGSANSLPPTSGGAYNANQNRTGAGGNTGGASGAAGAQQTFAQRLQNIIQRANTTGGDIQLIGPNKIIADERTNSLLVFATREDMATIKDIISKLDVVLAQVLIEAIILDVSLGDNFSLGVTGGQRPASTQGSSFGGLINNSQNQLGTGNGFLNQLIQTFTTNSADGITNITSVFTPASSITYPNGDGLNYFGTLNNKWDFSLSALAGNNNVKVLARPRIQTSHAVAANIFVGETRPYITGTYFDSGVGGSSRSQYQQTQIGISLNVLPLINTEGLVVMDIQEQVQQASPKGGGVIIDGNEVPITQDQTASAKVAVNTGETIVLGGFIQNQKADSHSGVPLLKDIPLLGALFRTTSTSNSRRELLVLLRPTVLPTPSVAALQSDIERNRLPGIRQAEQEFSKDQTKRNKKVSKKKPTDLDAE